ncbi:hypothetical protein [Natronosalvus vescus]|uniref:hypothetical protein n=1 Tax=Natronosalvus vescus TaxID=2953881 RepID=UPI0020918933|nr:hypothetical protein [Natronosalvus vescus]
MSESDDRGGDPEAHAHSPRPIEFQQGVTLDRRRFMRNAMVAGVAMTALGSGAVTAEEDGDDWSDASPFTVGGMQVLLGNLGWLPRRAATTNGTALWDQLHATALELEIRRNSFIGSIENDAEMLPYYLRLDMANALVEAAPDNDKPTTEQIVLEVLEDEVSNLLLNLFNYWTVDYLGAMRRIKWAYDDDTGDINFNDVFRSQSINLEDGSIISESLDWGNLPLSSADVWAGVMEEYLSRQEEEYDDPDTDLDEHAEFHDYGWGDTWDFPLGIKLVLPNNDEVSVPGLWGGENSGDDLNATVNFLPTADLSSSRWLEGTYAGDDRNFWLPEHNYEILHGDQDIPRPLNDSFDDDWLYPAHYGIHVAEREPGDDPIGNVALLDSRQFVEAHHAIMETYTTETGNIATMVDNLYDLAADGEITAEEVTSGSAIIKAAEEEEDPTWQHYAGYYRAVGIPEADYPTTIDLGGVTAVGKLFWTNPTADGDDDPSIPVGDVIDPNELTGEIHGALEITDIETDDPMLDDTNVNVGDVSTFYIDRNFKITEVHLDGPDDELTFPERGLFEPDDDTDDIIDALLAAYEQEQETREGDTTLTVNVESDDDGSGIGFPSFGFGSDFGSGLLGLGIITGVVLLVVSFVTDLLPWTR